MPVQRVMNGLAEFTPGQGIGDLRVERMVSRRPEPKYLVRCDRCQTTSTVTHSALRNRTARCQFSGCGKLSIKRRGDLLAEQRQRIAEHEQQRQSDELAASVARMEAESGDWERPTRYSPEPDLNPAMSERERLAIRERREAEEHEQREAERIRLDAERAAAEERSEREAEEQTRQEKRRAFEAEWVSTDRDPKLYVSDAMRSASMPKAEAEAFTAKAAAQFAESSEFAPYRNLENADTILGYLRRNGINIADVETIRAAFNRLRDLGLLKAKPTPAAPQPVERPHRVNLAITSPRSVTGPKTYKGRDYATGQEREFTQREVDRMSSLEFQRAFKIVPSVAELFDVMSESR